MPRGLKVYVIGDTRALCDDLHSWLAGAGHEVVCAPEGRPALHAVSLCAPDLIVLGLSGGGNEGLETYHRLGNHRQLRQVPVVVVGDDADLEFEMLDAFDFQVRPLDHERLRVCLQRLSGVRGPLPAIPLADPELAAVKAFLLANSGLHFNQHNLRILERGLLRRIQALRIPSLEKYHRYLTAGSGNHDELNKLLGLLTVGETCFFRYRVHREAFLNYVMPKLLERNRGQRRLRFWSAGCSTGEEPYSLAILLQEHFPELADWDVQILATDINKRALRQAREGLYGERSLRSMEAEARERCFQRVGNRYLLKERFRRMVRFEYLNLQTDPFPEEHGNSAGFDLLLCRNVLIYFELETTRRIVERFSRVLKESGYLFMGHAETMQNVSDRFQRHHQQGAFFYQPKAPAAAVIAASPPQEARPAATSAPVASVRPPTPEKVAAPAPRPPDELYRAAMAAFEREKFGEALRLFDQLLEQQPAEPRALVGKGLLLANQGRYGDARICCARALRVNDLLPEAYLLRGLILDMEGFLERALVEYQKALLLEPGFVMAHYLAAKIHGRRDDVDKLRRALRNTVRSLEQSPGQSIIPFSGGLSREVFLNIARRELAAIPLP